MEPTSFEEERIREMLNSEIEYEKRIYGGILGEDNICPVNNELCDDECCVPGGTCNLWGWELNGIEPDHQ